MENPILISNLNDFIFCPISIYYHNIYGDEERTLYQSEYQINGTDSHRAIDEKMYSSRSEILQSIDVYSPTYNLVGKIDSFNISTGVLTERKKKIIKIYDGYILQIYAQCFALRDMGYDVNKLMFYSYENNKTFEIPLPENEPNLFAIFKKVLDEFSNFDIDSFIPKSKEKCSKCIYSDLCDRSLAIEEQ